eukprot:760765-Hanusia_phi.AAC.8
MDFRASVTVTSPSPPKYGTIPGLPQTNKEAGSTPRLKSPRDGPLLALKAVGRTVRPSAVTLDFHPPIVHPMMTTRE